MLELLEKAIACEKVSTITITLKPNQKPKQATETKPKSKD